MGPGVRRDDENKNRPLFSGRLLDCFASLAMTSVASTLRLIVRRRRTGAVLGHEGVELFLVLGVAKAIEEVAEFDLLFFEPAQRVGAVFVEGAVAARRLAE